MKNTVLFFAHGNGFPAGCYQKFFSYLKDEYALDYIDCIGLDPKFPVTSNWPELTLQIIDYLKRKYQKPVYAIGHSLGGILNFQAAATAPDIFQSLIILDAPFFLGLKALALRLFKNQQWIERFSPAQATKTRKRFWHSPEEALKYFQTKKVFQSFDSQCLKDYVTYGTKPVEEGVMLKFDPRIEYQIYRTLPDNLKTFIPKVKIPIHLIHGENSDIMSRYDVKRMQRQITQMHYYKIQGGHLFPFEQPELAAMQVKKILNDFEHG